MDRFLNGLSMDSIKVNWIRMKELFAKLGIVVPHRVIDGVSNCKEGAAELLLEDLYRHFTGQQISKVIPGHRVDFSDHAYQVRAVCTDHFRGPGRAVGSVCKKVSKRCIAICINLAFTATGN